MDNTCIHVVDSRIRSSKTITAFRSFLGNKICKLFKIHVTRNPISGIPLENIKKSHNFPVVCHLDFRVWGHFALSALPYRQVSYELSSKVLTITPPIFRAPINNICVQKMLASIQHLCFSSQ